MKNLLVICLLILSLNTTAQYQTTQGTFFYKVDIQVHPDSTFRPFSSLIMTTNDTLVRIDSESFQMGKQHHINHLKLHKSYLLIQYNDKKYAIQTNDAIDTTASKYQFKYKNKKKKINGIQSKMVIVSSEYYTKPVKIWYFPSVNPAYLSVLKGIKGLPVEYYIPTQEGMLHYQLEKIDFTIPNKDTFGIPSDYKRISFDAFIEEVSQ